LPNPAPPGGPPEDAILQNQLTLLTDVRPEHLARLRAVLALIDLYGRRLSPPGSLVGISTIHSVRWTLLDEGRRLLMVSNYDGTWENYIDEFAEMILSGLDALWTSAPDNPRAGAQDVAALKQFLRRHQAPANVFYCAYPEASVLNLTDDLAFARWFGWIFRRLTAGRAAATAAPRRLPVSP
jgi:histidinol-phosphate/aromatic aminotransferase/cobyric acid decarboxylase-like protein